MGMLGALLASLPAEQAWFYANTAAAAQPVDPALLMAIMQVESSFDPLATHLDRDGISSYGLMQLRPETAALLAGRTLTTDELFDPTVSTLLGAKYLADQLRRYQGSVPDAVAAYNAGTARRNADGQYINSRGETNVQRYVDAVLAAYARWSGAGAIRPAPSGSGADVSMTITATAAPPRTLAHPWSALLTNPWVVGGLVLAGGALLVTLTSDR